MQNALKDELHNILSGKSKVSYGATIQTIAGYLDDGEKAGADTEIEKHFKRKETERLENYIDNHNLWVRDIDFSQYVSEGAEQKVYLRDNESVVKLNDGIYYKSWKEYFHNLILHNFFFPDTAYELLGFAKDEEVLFAVVQQKYVSITSVTDLLKVKEFLLENGFENNRNNDYINREIGVILEDLHDENVLTQDDMLYFIDTVFYLTEDFWKE